MIIVSKFSILVISLVEYRYVGCFKDNGTDRAIPSLEGSCSLLDGNTWNRVDAVDKCHRCAESKGFSMFALQNGGECKGDYYPGTYDKHGESEVCNDGKGGAWANDVYVMRHETGR